VVPEKRFVFMQEKRYLVAYFSHAGHAKKIAERIAKRMGGDLFEIVPQEAYSKFFPQCVRRAVQEKKEDARPALIGKVENMQQYTDVVIGYPCWCGSCPQIVLSFVEQYDFAGKTIHLFNTHKGSGSKGTEDIRSAVNDGIVEKSLPAEQLKKDDAIARWLIV